jgi:hypothetical protein
MQNSKFKIQNSLTIFYILYFAFCVSCSIPSLESAECTEAREAVKELYSYHFGNEMKPTAENLKARERFLTPELTTALQKFQSDIDPFTLSTDFPKAFRVGGCKTVAPDKTESQVLLFWKDDERSRQQEITVETIRQNDRWLINNIFNNSSDLRQTLNNK